MAGQWWYESATGERTGPVPEAEIRRLLAAGEIHSQTLVWCYGMPDWAPIAEVSSIYQPPPLPHERSAEVQYQPKVHARSSRSGPQVRPWVRFWARNLDYGFASIALGLLAAILAPSLLEVNASAFALVTIFAWVFVESWLLSTWGTTPGKWLLRVSVHTPDDRRPSYSTALNRSFLVWWRGMAAGIPLVQLFTAIHAYEVLTKTGRTTWDRDTKLEVTHEVIDAPRAILAVAFGIGVLLLAGLANS